MGRSESRHSLWRITGVEEPNFATIFGGGCGFMPMGQLLELTYRLGGNLELWRNTGLRSFSIIPTTDGRVWSSARALHGAEKVAE